MQTDKNATKFHCVLSFTVYIFTFYIVWINVYIRCCSLQTCLSLLPLVCLLMHLSLTLDLSVVINCHIFLPPLSISYSRKKVEINLISFLSWRVTLECVDSKHFDKTKFVIEFMYVLIDITPISFCP